MSKKEAYVFRSLIEANTGEGLKTEFNPASPSNNQNAAGEIKPRSFEEVGKRAKQFGLRFAKAAS